MIAKLCGFLGCKSDEEPETASLWRGLQRLDNIVDFCKVIKTAQRVGL